MCEFGTTFYIREEESDGARGKRHLPFLQSQRNGLFCGHCTPFCGEMCKFGIINFGMYNCYITLDRSLRNRWTRITHFLAHCICPGEDLHTAFGLSLIHVKASQALQGEHQTN